MKKNQEDYLVKVYKFWDKFYAKLHIWMKPELDIIRVQNLNWSDSKKPYDLIRNATIKKYISSTHTWIKGKQHYSKKLDNWFEFTLECKICGMAATKYEEVDFDTIETYIPSRDSHNSFITRTCQEVLTAKRVARKAHKGGKCIQCQTYDCLYKGI